MERDVVLGALGSPSGVVLKDDDGVEGRIEVFDMVHVGHIGVR